MPPEQIVRAVDTGRRNTKYTTGVGNDGKPLAAMFPSLAVPSDRAMPVRTVGDKKLKVVDIPVGNLYYTVGPDAMAVRGVIEPQVLQHDRYSETDEYLALTLGALHYMKVDRIDHLLVGLPVATMRQPKKVSELQRRLTGTHKLTDKKSVTVANVRVLAQPSGALLRHGLENGQFDKVRRQKNLIIDPGHYTFDWVVADGLTPLEGVSNSLQVGMFAILRSIAEGISRDANTNYRDYAAIDAALRGTAKIQLFQKEYPLARYMPLARKLAEQAVSEMQHYVGDASDIADIVLVGGGAFFFAKSLRAAFPRHKLIELPEPILANVIGFHLAGMELAKAMARTAEVKGNG